MKSNVEIKQVTQSEQARVAFADIEIGDWYHSESCHGLCVKLTSHSYYSFTKKELVSGGSPGWQCRLVHGLIKWRFA